MESFDCLIIGGGAAGTSAAENIRTKDPAATIAIVSDEIHPLYSRVMLSKPGFFLGQIPFDKIWLRGEKWYQDNRIIFIGGKTATGLDPVNKVLTLDDGKQITYKKLLLAMGVRTRKWDVSGSEKNGVYSLRTLEDGKKIMEAIKTAKRAVTIGGGFISFEMADLMKLANLETTLLLRESYFWQPTLDEPSGKMIEEAMEKAGVKILKNVEAKEVIGGEKVEGIILKDGTGINCDIVIVGIGVVPPEIEWLKGAGLNVGCGINTNEFMETNLPDVWAAGDIAEYKDLLLEENVQLGNWVNAHEQGRVAGVNMVDSLHQTGSKKPFKFISFYTTQGFGITIAFVGDARSLPDRIVINRGSPEIGSYGRILLAKTPVDSEREEIVGATLINRTQEMSAITKLTENNIDLSAKHLELSDPNFDLKTLIPS